eukprot:Rhum_TRINITY_DN15193_c2_g1::Rhum_TRINITY_DN15193_c2_g1_i1::g.143075::m.143075
MTQHAVFCGTHHTRRLTLVLVLCRHECLRMKKNLATRRPAAPEPTGSCADYLGEGTYTCKHIYSLTFFCYPISPPLFSTHSHSHSHPLSHPIPLPLLQKKNQPPTQLTPPLYFCCTYVTHTPTNKKKKKKWQQKHSAQNQQRYLFFLQNSAHTSIGCCAQTCLTLPETPPPPPSASRPLPRPKSDYQKTTCLRCLLFSSLSSFFYILLECEFHLGGRVGGVERGETATVIGCPCLEAYSVLHIQTPADGMSSYPPLFPLSPLSPPPKNLASFAPPTNTPHTFHSSFIAVTSHVSTVLRRHTYNCLLSCLPPCPHPTHHTPPLSPPYLSLEFILPAHGKHQCAILHTEHRHSIVLTFPPPPLPFTPPPPELNQAPPFSEQRNTQEREGKKKGALWLKQQ